MKILSQKQFWLFAIVTVQFDVGDANFDFIFIGHLPAPAR